jgi:outer membrane protein assembly factor BamB
MPVPSRRLIALTAGPAVALAAVAWYLRPRPEPPAAEGPEVLWVFEQPQRGAVLSSPQLAGGRVFVGAIRDGLSPRGVVYALDAGTGKVVWQFDDDGDMLHMFSSPTAAGGRVFIGEGMHANPECKLYALDADTGRRLWSFPVASHVESTPTVAGGVAYFGGGDEGVFAADAATGRELWHFNEGLHVDSKPAVVAGRVYAGSGDSRRYKATEMFCLDAATGRPLWRVPSALPAWGSPLADGGRVVFGVGKGRLAAGAARPAGGVEDPAGGLVCLDADTGRVAWRYDAGDLVIGRPAADAGRVYCGAADGAVHAVDQETGRAAWKAPLGAGGIVAAPVLCDGRLYAVASGGLVACLDPADGRVLSRFDVAAHTRTEPRVFSTPAVTPDAEGGRHRVYFGAELRTATGSLARVYCLRW